MNIKHSKICSLLIIVLVSFSAILTGCSGGDTGGGGTGGGGDIEPTPSTPEMAIVSISGIDSNSSVKKGGVVVVTIGLNTSDTIATCGYQCALKFNSDYFDFVANSSGGAAAGLSSTIGIDSNNKNIVRAVAIPTSQNGSVDIGKDNPNLVKLAFKAKNNKNITVSAQFKITNQNNFLNSVSVYDDENKAVSLAELNLGAAKNVYVKK